jgi:cytochrome c
VRSHDKRLLNWYTYGNEINIDYNPSKSGAEIMKKTCLTIGLILLVSASANVGMSSDATVAKGKELFNNPGLGGSANQSSCGSCHPDGRGLKNAGSKENLTDMINMCIERPLKGQALDAASPEMKALQLYIKSLK